MLTFFYYKIILEIIQGISQITQLFGSVSFHTNNSYSFGHNTIQNSRFIQICTFGSQGNIENKNKAFLYILL